MRANNSHCFKRRYYIYGGVWATEVPSVSGANSANRGWKGRWQSPRCPGGWKQSLSVGAQQIGSQQRWARLFRQLLAHMSVCFLVYLLMQCSLLTGSGALSKSHRQLQHRPQFVHGVVRSQHMWQWLCSHFMLNKHIYLMLAGYGVVWLSSVHPIDFQIQNPGFRKICLFQILNKFSRKSCMLRKQKGKTVIRTSSVLKPHFLVLDEDLWCRDWSMPPFK